MARVDLSGLLERESFRHAFICTFTFEPSFFEDFCLEHFRALGEGTSVTVITDARTYSSLTILDASQRPRLANLRYLLHPVAVHGVFHAKVFLLASKDKGLLVIGSGNFTRSGLGTNAELVGVYRYQRNKTTENRALFQQALGFLQTLAKRWPSDDLFERLDELESDADWLKWDKTQQDGSPRLIHNLNEALWDNLCNNLPKNISEVHVLSRYFDAEPHILERVFDDVGPGQVVLWTENDVTTMTPAWFDLPKAYRKRVEVRSLSIADGEYHQPLHAKAIAFVSPKMTRLAFGSANFSRAGLFSAASAGNLEVALVSDAELFRANDVRRLFDPQNVSYPIQHVRDLRTGTRESLPVIEPAPIQLLEATLDEDALTCRAAGIAQPLGGAKLTAALEFADGHESRVPLAAQGTSLEARLPTPLTRRCNEGAATIALELLEAGQPARQSNKLFLANLLDVETGGTGRLQRRVRTAQRGAAQFVLVLDELLKQGETDQLKAFLTHCDIPLVLAGRFRVPHARGPWAPPGHWRTVGTRHIRDYETLHDAVIGFAERHLARLKRHCERASGAGITNFMHIALAIVSTVRAQTERALQGIESIPESMDWRVWYNFRKNVERYLLIVERALTTMVDGYFMALAKQPRSRIDDPSVGVDRATFVEHVRGVLGVRTRLLGALNLGVQVVTTEGQELDPPFMPRDLLEPTRWATWEDKMYPLLGRLAKVAG